jgi:hypothetical protein
VECQKLRRQEQRDTSRGRFEPARLFKRVPQYYQGDKAAGRMRISQVEKSLLTKKGDEVPH